MAMPYHDPDQSGNNDPSNSDATPRQPYKDAKTFRDLNGAQWFAHEVTGDALGGGRSCLLLVSAQQVRRIERYPADWRILSLAALLALPHADL